MHWCGLTYAAHFCSRVIVLDVLELVASCHRYLDMIVTEGVRETFRKRSKVMSTIRQMLEQQGFLEVETPVLESTAGMCLFVPDTSCSATLL